MSIMMITRLGRWVRQRYRYDAQPETLHFRGERNISAQEFEQSRRTGTIFPIDALKQLGK